MNNTGRLKATLCESARRIAYHDPTEADVRVELEAMTSVCQAHVVMLFEENLIGAAAKPLMRELFNLRKSNFRSITASPTPRGLYMAFEDYLLGKCGAGAGCLSAGRSRNDLNATIQSLIFRNVWRRVTSDTIRVLSALEKAAWEFRGTIMPIHTQMQVASVSTYGHWLAGVGVALCRDIERLFSCCQRARRCPLGAAAINGTTLPINPSTTARLLGFQEAVLNSVDAIAGKDCYLEFCSCLASLGTLLSRVAFDYRIWTMNELNWLELPDALCGASSFLPQKRNPWLLELIKARAARVAGTHASLALAMCSEPYSNALACGAESLGSVASAAIDISDALRLLRLVVLSAQPVASRMIEACSTGYPWASTVTERWNQEGGLSTREAHWLVGYWIACGCPSISETFLLADVPPQIRTTGSKAKLATELPSPQQIVDLHRFGGGPGLSDDHPQWRFLYEYRSAAIRRLLQQSALWNAARRELFRRSATVAETDLQRTEGENHNNP